MFSEQLSDPKMNIPQNKELFEFVIKTGAKGAGAETSGKTPLKGGMRPQDEEMEKELQAIRGRLQRKLEKVEDQDHLDFIQFMMANYDYQHDYWKLNKDLTLKLKEEESRAAFLRSSKNFATFQSLMGSASGAKVSGHGGFKSQSPSPGPASYQQLHSPSGPSLQQGKSGSDFFALASGNFAPATVETQDGPAAGGGRAGP